MTPGKIETGTKVTQEWGHKTVDWTAIDELRGWRRRCSGHQGVGLVIRGS